MTIEIHRDEYLEQLQKKCQMLALYKAEALAAREIMDEINNGDIDDQWGSIAIKDIYDAARKATEEMEGG